MSHWSDPQVIIPHYDIPPGVCFNVQTREGTIICQKQADGGWEVIYFDGSRRSESSRANSLTNEAAGTRLENMKDEGREGVNNYDE